MKCGKCGVDNPPEMNFCVNCGSSLQREIQPGNPPGKSGKGPLIIIICLSAVIFLAGAVLIGLLLMNKMRDSSNKSAEKQTSSQESSTNEENEENQSSNQESTAKAESSGTSQDLSTIDLKEYVNKEKADLIKDGIIEEKANERGIFSSSDKSITVSFYDNDLICLISIQGTSDYLPAFFGVRVNESADTMDSKLKTDFSFLYSEDLEDGNTQSFYIEKSTNNILTIQNDTKSKLINEMAYVTYGSTDTYKEEVEEKLNTIDTISNEDYILPYSDSIVYTYEELFTLTDDQIRIAINEIYARHGRKFKDATLQSYFDSKSWYNGSISADAFDESVMNQNEEDNAYRLSNIQNDTLPVYNPDILGIYVYEDENLYYTITINSTEEEDVLYIDAAGGSNNGSSGGFSGYMYVLDFYDTYYQSDIGYLSIYYTNQQITITDSTSTFGGSGFYGFDGVYYKLTDFQ